MTGAEIAVLAVLGYLVLKGGAGSSATASQNNALSSALNALSSSLKSLGSGGGKGGGGGSMPQGGNTSPLGYMGVGGLPAPINNPASSTPSYLPGGYLDPSSSSYIGGSNTTIGSSGLSVGDLTALGYSPSDISQIEANQQLGDANSAVASAVSSNPSLGDAGFMSDILNSPVSSAALDTTNGAGQTAGLSDLSGIDIEGDGIADGGYYA